MNKIEIDHNGAYLCGHKPSELLNLHYNGLKVLFEGGKRLLKSDWKQWRLFCFVLLTLKLSLGHFNGRFNVVLDYFTAFVFKQVKNCHFDGRFDVIGRCFNIGPDLWIDKKTTTETTTETKAKPEFHCSLLVARSNDARLHLKNDQMSTRGLLGTWLKVNGHAGR